MPDGNYNGQYQSDAIRPVRRSWSHPPYLLRQLPIGKEAQFFSTLKIWIHSPTLQYPTASLNMGLANAKASTFTRLAGVDELNVILTALTQWRDEAATILPALQAQAEALKKQLQQIELMQQYTAFGQRPYDPTNNQPLENYHPIYDVPQGDIR